MFGLEAFAVVANATTIIDFIWPKIQSLMEHITSPDITKDQRILEEIMQGIPDLMLVAESSYAHNSNISHYVHKLRKLAYAAEDLLDELSYHELQQQVLNKGSASTSKAPVTPERIHRLIKDLNRVIGGLKGAFAVADKLPRSVSPTPTETTSTIDLNTVRGREEEKQQMMEFLTPDPLIHGQKVFFFAITGIGGLGKTTLAQYAFNNLEDRFDLKVWICVSNAFDRKRFLQEIIEGITRDSCNIKSINALEETIKRKVKGKTLLLVLDDVWSTEWMGLLPPLQFSEAKCCKVIVTTREVNNIKQTHDYESKMLPLVGLQGEEFRRLFEEQAFGGKDPIEHRGLREIGEKIARKLKGNPLAAKTVGAVLRENLEPQHWKRVVEDDLWNLGDKPDDIMPALMLSYLHLPHQLRRCFSYCALFPQDYKFNRERLVWMWIAQGYVCANPNERLEDVGLKYFRELVSRSFFGEYYNGSHGTFYKMHDLLHDLATFVSLDECFMYREESSMSNEKALSCHHLSVNESNLHRLPADLHHIRTLIVFPSNQYSKMLVPWKLVPFKVLKSLKSVRVLAGMGKMLEYDWDKSKISANQVIWNDLGRLIHLRYLDLSQIFRICEPRLLESICSLYHLQTLLTHIQFHQEYPNGMNNLINLRHFDSGWHSFAKIPSIGKLVQLQKLLQFNVGKGSLHDIGQLKEMNQLNYLQIYKICQVEEADDAKNANMEKKKYLTSLSLGWCRDERTCCCKDSTIEHHDNVLEYLKPHNSLEHLRISDHKGSKPPSWLGPQSLQCIKSIELVLCKNRRLIPHLAQLPHLEYLRMAFMDLVVDLTDHGVLFPSLLNMRLQDTSIISEGISEEEGQISCQFFPKIKDIHCDRCKNLESLFFPLLLHGIPSTLMELRIHSTISEELKVELDRIKLTSNIEIMGLGYTSDNSSSE